MAKKETLDELKARAKEFVMTTFTTYSNRSELENKWEQNDKLYNCIPQKKTYIDGVANLNPPTTRKAVRTMLNTIDEIIWSQKPAFSLQGVGGQGDKKRAEINEKIINLQQEKIRFRQKLRQAIQSELIHGFVIAKVPYVLKEKYVVGKKADRTGILEIIKGIFEGEIKPQKNKVAIYDNIDFIPMSPFNMYWDYYAKWEDQEAIIEKISDVSESKLRLMQKTSPDSYFDIDKILKTLPDTQKETTDDVNKSEKMAHTSEITGLTGNFSPNKKRHELLECWCNFDIDNDGIDEECVITILDRTEVIRLELNPYDIQEKPYVFTSWEEIENADSLGNGICQLALNSQLALNDFTNQYMDNNTMSLDCMFIVDTMANIPKSQLASRPRGIIESNAGVDAVKPLRPPNTMQEAMSGISMMKNDIAEISGATANMQGLPSRYDTSATEASLMATAGQREIFSKLRNIEDNIIKPFLRKTYSYNMQFMSLIDIQTILGEEAFNSFLKENAIVVTSSYVPPVSDVLLSDYDFIPLGTTQTENKIIKGQQVMNLYNIALRSPQGIWDTKQLAKQVCKYVLDGDYSVLAPEMNDNLMTPTDENTLMLQGESPTVKLLENHLLHVQIHQQMDLPPFLEPIREKHIMGHIKFLQVQQQQQSQAGMPPQEQPVFAPKGITEGQAGQVQGLVTPPVSLGGLEQGGM